MSLYGNALAKAGGGMVLAMGQSAMRRQPHQNLGPIMHQPPSPVVPAGHAGRRGFTMLELIIVMVITGVMAAVATKPIIRTWQESSRQAAGREAAALVYRARAAAVQRSRTTWFVRTGSTVKILTDSSGVVVPYGRSIDLGSRHGVSVVATRDTMTFDPRGFSRLVSPAPRIIVANASGADTLCLTGLGKITTRGCP